ncbi:MAG TPA: hypothetical protein VN426_05550 [Syntrophomonadaceae bacterium]|nr:hypothetical protein [Syntrophomonadaceae bacterium]
MIKFIPKIKKNSLLLLAGIVWFIAGFNIIRIGTPEMLLDLRSPILPVLLSIIIFYLFFKLVFQKMVDKHCDRIKGYTEHKIVVFKFFDTRSYLIMAFMITLGVLLRNSHLLTPLCLGTFYTGLGGSLICAGLFFVIRYLDQYAD